MGSCNYKGPKFAPLSDDEIKERYAEAQEEMEEVLKWQKEEEERLVKGKTPQAKAAAKRAIPKVERRINTVKGNILYWKLRMEGKNHFYANLERNEFWDKLNNPDREDDENSEEED